MQVIVEWNEQKNETLKKTRNVCFEDVENCILNDEVIDVLPHHNPEKYPNQRIFVVRLADYIYYVPFVEDDKKIFLKNIIPSRKLNAKY
jgi:uncharacterized DUF497 family protein